MNRTTRGLLRGLAGGCLVMTGGACTIPLPIEEPPQQPPNSHDAGVPVEGIPLPSTATGFVQDLIGGSNVVGSWYAYGDGVGPNAGPNTGSDAANSDCQSASKGGFPASACSQIATPTPGATFPPFDVATSEQCTSGIAAQVISKAGSPDYADLWGSGIALDFNNPAGDAGVKSDLDLSRYKGIYFDLTIYPASAPMSNGAGAPPSAMRVNFPFTGEHGTDSPYWQGATKAASMLIPPADGSAQHVEIDWGDVGGPFYLSQQSPPVSAPPFDPTHVQSIQLQVFTSTTATTPYAFCVANLALVGK